MASTALLGPSQSSKAGGGRGKLTATGGTTSWYTGGTTASYHDERLRASWHAGSGQCSSSGNIASDLRVEALCMYCVFT